MSPSNPGFNAAAPCDWDALAQSFFEAISGGTSPPPGQLLEQLLPHIRRCVERHCSRKGASSAHAEDVLQDVLLRIWSKPPSRWRDEQDPKTTLLAWISTVTTRCLIDRFRRGRIAKNSELDVLVDPADETSHATRVEISSHLKAARQVLEKHYAVALPIFELLIGDPELSSKELATQLDRSPGNVDQIRFRMRLVLAEYLAFDDNSRPNRVFIESRNP